MCERVCGAARGFGKRKPDFGRTKWPPWNTGTGTSI